MAQETVVDFSVIKQKIIKTDEILRMFMETSNKLKKVQQAYKDIKLKHDQVALSLNRFQLENEQLSFNLENVKLNREKLQQENKELKEQIALLEDKYNQQAVQSQLEIKKTSR
ncbi:hypothetical protein NQ318_002365 [Aromia moschata]|uniref:Uncharacterized protein n=1 Tax=Aromia moschata TaxID=1265417 RepID=A0AAV8YG94_9CUCU|nr:hypothetical protein NQ318_002365 [Aromia moschata]